MSWTSVTDKMPGGTEYVLAAVPLGHGGYDIFVGMFIDGYGWCDTVEMRRHGDVTHWMALPSPPGG